MEFTAVLERVYSCVPGDFMAVRTEAEKAAKETGDKALAAEIKSLKKPSMGAWAVNQLVRWEADQIGHVELAAHVLGPRDRAPDRARGEGLPRAGRVGTAKGLEYRFARGPVPPGARTKARERAAPWL